MASDLWDRVKSLWGDGVPHGLDELKLSLPDGLVKFQLRYTKTVYHDQSVEISFSDSKETGSIMGKVAEEKWLTAENPFFLLSPQYERFYFSRDKEGMKDYLSAKKEYAVELENLQKKFEQSQQGAAGDLKRAEAEREKLMVALDKHEADWERGGFMDTVKVDLQWEKVHKQEEKISVANAILRLTSPPRIGTSYVTAIRTAGLEAVDLSRIVNAVSTKKRELMAALGVLPKTLTSIPVSDSMTLLVKWRDS